MERGLPFTTGEVNVLDRGSQGKSAARVDPGGGKSEAVIGVNASGEKTRALTVSVSAPAVTTGFEGALSYFRAQAVIEWGNDGTSQRATFDVLQGFTFSVSASFVRVWFLNIADPADPNAVPFQCGATVGYNTTSRRGDNKLTYYFDTPGASLNIRIPNFATAFYVYYGPIATAGLSIEYTDFTYSTVVWSGGTLPANTIPPPRFELFGDSYGMILAPVGVGAFDKVRVLFILSN